MADSIQLAPAAELAKKNGVRFPNESEEYRRARNALLAEEIELRRHIERVAEQRRALPPGGAVTEDYRFQGERGPVRFADLFGDKQTLAVYSYMFGPQRERPCPMCTSLLSAWDGEARDIEQRVALAVVARSPIERLARVQEGARLAASPALLGRRAARSAATTTRSRPTAATSRRSTSSRAATARSGISGAARWASRPPTPARTRAARPT